MLPRRYAELYDDFVLLNEWQPTRCSSAVILIVITEELDE